MSTSTSYQKCLKDELAARCERNARYSVRAFAKALDIDAGALSRILSGKQVPSFKLAQKLTRKLALSPDEERYFISSIAETQRTRGMLRLNPAFKKMPTSPQPKDLSIDLYRVIADWYHVAIMELTYLPGFRSDARWVARELGISATEAKLGIERLTSLGLLKEESGKLTKSSEQLTTADKHLTTPALRNNQKQLLNKAIHSLENDPIEDRSVTSMTMAIDPEKLPIAKRLIDEFSQMLCALLESGARKRVYNLEVCLYPLQKKSEKTL